MQPAASPSHPLVLVTGGTGGIGRAITLAARAAGWHVIVHTSGRHLDGLDWLDAADVVEADLRDPVAIEAMFDQISTRFGRLDALVNNAGIEDDQKEQLDTSSWHNTFAVNLFAAVECARRALPLMDSGVIVNISSAAGSRGTAYLSGSLAYSVSKAALDKVTEQLALMVSPQHRVVGIAPGHVPTGMWRDGLDQSRRDEITSDVPLRRFVNTEDVASAVLMALDNPAITGTTLSLDAGLTVRAL